MKKNPSVSRELWWYSHQKMISVQHLTWSSPLKIDTAVMTRISSHRDSSLCLGCYRNLRFILLLASKQDWKKSDDFTCATLFVATRQARTKKEDKVKRVKNLRRGTKSTVLSSYWMNQDNWQHFKRNLKSVQKK